MINKWLLKSEPDVWSWQMQVDAKTTSWDGVRNFQASNNFKKMKPGDLAFFYHSGKERAIVGIVVIISESYIDNSDVSKKFFCVDVEAREQLLYPVSLANIKKDERLQNLVLVKQNRLSVMPIDDKSWDIILDLSKNKK